MQNVIVIRQGYWPYPNVVRLIVMCHLYTLLAGMFVITMYPHSVFALCHWYSLLLHITVMSVLYVTIILILTQGLNALHEPDSILLYRYRVAQVNR